MVSGVCVDRVTLSPEYTQMQHASTIVIHSCRRWRYVGPASMQEATLNHEPVDILRSHAMGIVCHEVQYPMHRPEGNRSHPVSYWTASPIRVAPCHREPSSRAWGNGVIVGSLGSRQPRGQVAPRPASPRYRQGVGLPRRTRAATTHGPFNQTSNVLAPRSRYASPRAAGGAPFVEKLDVDVHFPVQPAGVSRSIGTLSQRFQSVCDHTASSASRRLMAPTTTEGMSFANTRQGHRPASPHARSRTHECPFSSTPSVG